MSIKSKTFNKPHKDELKNKKELIGYKERNLGNLDSLSETKDIHKHLLDNTVAYEQKSIVNWLLENRLQKPWDDVAGFLRLPQVLELYPVSKSTLYAGIKSGRLPAPVRLSRRCVAWRKSDIMALIESKN